MATVTLSATDFNILKPNLSLVVAAIDSAEPGSFLMVECGRFSKQQQENEHEQDRDR